MVLAMHARVSQYHTAKDGLVAGLSPTKPRQVPSDGSNARQSQPGWRWQNERQGFEIMPYRHSMMGTMHENKYKVESVWQMERMAYPEPLQAATKIAVKDAHAQWTTYASTSGLMMLRRTSS